MQPALIKIRIDVDYPYPSRARSFVYTALGIRMGRDYLKNSKIIARMINESSKETKAHWFFTPKTFPDKELLSLIDNDRHEIGLHIVKDPKKELELLEITVGKKAYYYTIHGTARLVARIMWKRWKASKPAVPDDFPLQSFYQFTTSSLDVICHTLPAEKSYELVEKYIHEGHVIHFHPIWLFQRGRINHRGPYYKTLRRILDVDKEMETLVTRKKTFFTMANDAEEYMKGVTPTEKFIKRLKERNVDIFTFIERKWCCPIIDPPRSWVKASDNIALLEVTNYDGWLKSIGKKTRNMIRKATKSGIRATIVEPSEKLAEGVWRIYNETPIRQERGFPHYGASLETVKMSVLSPQNSTYIGAYFEEELAGFIHLVHGNQVTIISQILSLQKYLDKAVNNALVAKAVEICASMQIQWLMYGRMGNHPSLDSFKTSNGCIKFKLNRFYLPLTRKGRIAIKLGLHREIKDTLPLPVKYRLMPIYNWLSRTKAKTGIRSNRPTC